MNQNEFPLPGEAQLRFILESATLAPSADNRHPLRFEVVDNSVFLRHVEAELPPRGGYKRVLALLSLGALVENLAIAATRHGYCATTTLFPDNAPVDCVVRVVFRPDAQGEDPLCSMIPLRHTNRKLYFQGPELHGEEKARLALAIQASPACSLTWLDEPVLRKKALRLMRRAEAERFRVPLLHQELFSAIRFDVGWNVTSEEGLPPGVLGVEKPLRPFFTLIRHWPVMRILNLLHTHYFLGWRASYIPCRWAPNLGVIAVKSMDDQSIYEAGRAFQRTWLTATRLGRVVQPMPAAALYALEGARLEGISRELQLWLSAGWRELTPGETPLMLFRLGVAQAMSIHTGRRPLSSMYSPLEG